MSKYEFIISAKDRTAAAFKSINSSLLGMQTRIALVVGAAGMGALVKSSLEANDVLAKTADRIGISTEALVAMRFAAEQTGASTESMDKSLEKMLKNIGEVGARGTGEAAPALEHLGIAIADIKDLAPEEQFQLIAEKMGNLKTQADKVFVAQKLFGREGTKLVNTLALGADGLEDMMTRSAQLGNALSRIDAAKIEMANDAINESKKAFEGVVNQITVQVAPYLQILAEKFTNASIESKNFTGEIESGFNAAENVILKTAVAVNVVTGYINSAYEGYRSLPAWMQELGIMGALIGGRKGLAVIAAVGKAADDTKYTVEWFNSMTDGEVSFYEWFTSGNEEARAKLEEMGRTVKEVKDEGTETSLVSGLFSTKEASEVEGEIKSLFDRVGELRQKAMDDINARATAEDQTVSVNFEADIDSFLDSMEAIDAIKRDPLGLKSSDILGEIEYEKFDFEKAFDEAGYWEAFEENGLTSITPTVDLAELSAGSQAMIDAATTTFQQIHEERLQFAGMDEQLEQERYQRQLELMEAEVALIEKKGLLTQELEQSYMEAREDAEKNHLSRLSEIREEREDEQAGYWEKWLEAAEENLTDFDELSANTIENFSNRMGSAVESMVFDSESLGEAFYGVMEGMARSVVNALGQMAAQWVAYQLVQMTVGKATALSGVPAQIANAQAASIQAGINAFSSTAAIPVVGPALAPGAMGAALSVTQPMAAAVASIATAGAAASFEGGGYTGSGIRAGGLDGRGGYMAMLHPQEYVTDFTKQQTVPQRGGDSYVTHIHAMDADSVQNLLVREGKHLSRGLAKYGRRNG